MKTKKKYRRKLKESVPSYLTINQTLKTKKAYGENYYNSKNKEKFVVIVVDLNKQKHDT